jgi:hypothetical protein
MFKILTGIAIITLFGTNNMWIFLGLAIFIAIGSTKKDLDSGCQVNVQGNSLGLLAIIGVGLFIILNPNLFGNTTDDPTKLTGICEMQLQVEAGKIGPDVDRSSCQK